MDKREKFDRTFRPCLPLMYRLAFGLLQDSDEASDAVQVSLIRIWDSYNPAAPGSPQAFSLTVTRRVCLNRLRDKRALCRLEEIPEPQAEEAPPQQDSGEMCRNLAFLPADQREAVALSAFCGLSTSEIADEIGTTAANARQLISRGRKKLRQLIENSIKKNR